MSDTPKHTPGPWGIEPDPCHYDTMTTVTAGGTRNKPPVNQMIVAVGGYANVDEAEANARLISAAPELYEALKELMDVQGKSVIGAPVKPWSNAMDKALRAVRKVEGES